MKKPELLAAYVDQIISKETGELFEWGLEGITFTKDSNGKRHFKPELLKDGSKQLNELGVGNIMDPRYIHYSMFSAKASKNGGPLFHEAYNMIVGGFKSGKITHILGMPKPALSQERNDEVSKIMAPINTFVQENEMKFIVGEKSMNEWEAFVEKVKKLGNIDRVLELYNEGKQYQFDSKRIFVEID